MRSIFFVKKTRAAIEKVHSLQADIIVLDLEDSIEQKEKQIVRELYLDALRDRLFGSAKVFLRSSSLTCIEDVHQDITNFTGSGIEGFMLPKIENEGEVIQVEQLISDAENDKDVPAMKTKLIPIIETLPAYFSLERIAMASKRNVALIGGSGDFTSEALCEDHSTTYDAYFSKIVLAAKSTGILPLWGVHDRIDDHAGFYTINNKMKKSGFAGTAALTPKQVVMANAIYDLSPKELKWIRSVTNNGPNIKLIQPSVQESRQMIGPPHRVKAENMIKQHKPECKRINKSATVKRSSNGLSPDVKIGEINSIPHEYTITDGIISMWDSSFLQYSSNGILTREKSALKYVPFSLSTTLAAASSVQCFSYFARAHLGFKNMFQVRPLAPGDRVRALFRIDDVLLKKGGDNNSYAVAKTTHWLANQEDKVVLQLEKTTMFQPSHCSPKSATLKNMKSLNPDNSPLFKSLIHQAKDTALPLKASPMFSAGEIVVHDVVKIMGHSEVRMLCFLLKILNPHHHNTVRYNFTDILVPGPFVMSAAISNATPDIGEVIYENIPTCINPNKVNLGDQIGTLTFVEKCSVLESNPNLEEIILKHVAIKNTDMEDIAGLNIPQELFSKKEMKPSEYEQLCVAKLPLLIHKVACVLTRRVIRVRPGFSKPASVPCELLL